jgi:predicted MPP superfamily phosphohydrolase
MALLVVGVCDQVPRLLAPIAKAVEFAAGPFEDERIRVYLNRNWHSEENLRLSILTDFFRHGFDGDGE